MTPALVKDADALRHALSAEGDQLVVALSRETVEFMARVADARAHGHEIVLSRVPEELSPAEAAQVLGVSRPHVRKLMNRGDLPYRVVGTHHRIPAAELRRYQEAERERRHDALIDFLHLENELGLTE
ncbi:MAG: helix-turn-helix domain-containing protein [Propionibacteriaceae bacterium]|jgi:excisionase family DNA binding protein|nr:helix-turn-helix domain-containing protein [Propionibacteriaceae bacterium]